MMMHGLCRSKMNLSMICLNETCPGFGSICLGAGMGVDVDS